MIPDCIQPMFDFEIDKALQNSWSFFCIILHTIRDHSANGRWCHTVTSSPIGWARTQNNPSQEVPKPSVTTIDGLKITFLKFNSKSSCDQWVKSKNSLLFNLSFNLLWGKLIDWSLSDEVIFKICLLKLFYEVISSALPVKLVLGEHHRMISQHWFR